MFLSEADLKPAFGLSRVVIFRLVQMLPRQKPHGWSHRIQILITIYWLASGASYRATADIFDMPTACRIAHNVEEEMMTMSTELFIFAMQKRWSRWVLALHALLAKRAATVLPVPSTDAISVFFLLQSYTHKKKKKNQTSTESFSPRS